MWDDPLNMRIIILLEETCFFLSVMWQHHNLELAQLDGIIQFPSIQDMKRLCIKLHIVEVSGICQRKVWSVQSVWTIQEMVYVARKETM
jgi:hypothetical protein